MNARRRSSDERGSVSVWAALIVAALTLIVGISVDLTGQIAAKQHANDIAAQAARVAGQQLDSDTVMGGGSGARVDIARARARALAFITRAGMEGSVTGTGGTRLQITVTGAYRPVFLTAIGLGPLTVSGTATARLVRAQNGTER